MSSDVEDVFFEASEHEAASDADSTRLVDRPWQQSNGADGENTPSTPSAAETSRADARGDDREVDQERSREGNARKEDLFLELAQDSDETKARPPSRHERAASRLSQAAKRRSLPADAEIADLTSSGEHRPKSRGSAFHGRAFSRPSALPSDLQRQPGPQQSTPIRDSIRADDSVSVSGRSLSGRAQEYTMQPSRAYATPSLSDQRLKSPDLPSYGRRRPSFGTASVKSRTTELTQTKDGEADSQDGSLTAGSERKHSLPESSAESQGAETVWDELDDLKSRIKKLELTGKLPTSSGAAISGESSERPRTATTAPTTITSSPKHERKITGSDTKSPSADLAGSNLANVHPLLHSALAKAKSLLQPSLYRMLEATASDSLQLAAMTGSAGPQGTAFSAASIINGVTVSDRHVRRKADAMCRNLTDLTLALCDGKHENTVAASSPLTAHSVQPSPTIRNSRSSIGTGENIHRNNSRPVSRLEARRTSILGISAGQSVSGSPRESTDDLSNASEQEGTPTHVRAPPQELRRISRSNSRLLGVRSSRYEETSADEDPTVRPPSRAMTDAGSNFRNRLSGQHQSPGQSGTSPSLRESLIARRANAGAHDANRELPRVSSLNTDLARRRWTKEVTPPVMEEEGDAVSEYTPPSSHSRRRVTSIGQFRERRTLGDGVPSRTASLSSRRHMAME
ncbi:hypothetical protein KC361_g1021 [Hortaea werneckii]|nr:hypothetical protein KC361_g1021 [Hortaea werneckii]